jgi:cytidylate kinase
MSAELPAPVIAIDGPTASGKGTVAQRLALVLGWHYLDSGALYRLVALRAIETHVAAEDAPALAALASRLAPVFDGNRILLDGRDVALDIRREDVGSMASRIAVHPLLRDALLRLQQGFRRPPGLVADGRDMGTVVFPDAALKVFLTASTEARADRRHKQLIEKGFSSNLTNLLADLKARDARDASRAASPLRPAEDARLLDSSQMPVDSVVKLILSWHRAADPG